MLAYNSSVFLSLLTFGLGKFLFPFHKAFLAIVSEQIPSEILEKLPRTGVIASAHVHRFRLLHLRYSAAENAGLIFLSLCPGLYAFHFALSDLHRGVLGNTTALSKAIAQ